MEGLDWVIWIKIFVNFEPDPTQVIKKIRTQPNPSTTKNKP